MARERRNSAKLVAVLAILALVAIFLAITYSKPLGLGGLSILALLILMRLISDIADRGITRRLKRERHAIRGAEGEEEIQGILSRLGDGYMVINDVACPSGNIDHIVLSRSNGVFLIETKSHRGRVDIAGSILSLNGYPPEKNFIAQILRNTYWLRDEIAPLIGDKPWITPLLVFSSAFVPHTPPIKGVRVLNKRYLRQMLTEASRGSNKPWLVREAVHQKLISQPDPFSHVDRRSREAA